MKTTNKAAEKETAPKKEAASGKTTAPAKAGQRSRAEAVTKVLRSVERKMTMKDLKPSLGDYIRLLQMQRELGGDPLTEIRVTWIEPVAEEPTGE